MDTPPTLPGVRKRACVKTMVGLAGCIVGELLSEGPKLGQRAWFVLLVPLVYFGIGVVEFVTARPARGLRGNWMDLPAWQRTILGLFLVGLGFVCVMILLFSLFAFQAWDSPVAP